MNAKFALTSFAAGLCISAAAWSGSVLAQIGQLAMLDTLEAGNWELRARDEPAPPQRMCLRNARKLIQLRHVGQNCSRIVVEDTPEQVTVQYTCRGKGYGRTQIRRESDSLVQIDSQGIADGRPFSFTAEARRIGGCHAVDGRGRMERASP